MNISAKLLISPSVSIFNNKEKISSIEAWQGYRPLPVETP
jgi:hypothetical protein